jgi:hypothetical protein
MRVSAGSHEGVCPETGLRAGRAGWAPGGAPFAVVADRVAVVRCIPAPPRGAGISARDSVARADRRWLEPPPQALLH